MQAEVERFHAGNLLLHDYYQVKVQDVAGDNCVVLVSVVLSPSNKRCVGGAKCGSLIKHVVTSRRLVGGMTHSTASYIYSVSLTMTESWN